MSMKDDVKNLANLRDNVVNTYQDSQTDRHEIHKIEWENYEEHKFSILAEAEINSGDLDGIASSLVKNVYSNNELPGLYTEVCQSSFFKIKDAQHWISNEAANYPVFIRYLMACERLRWEVASILSARINNERKREDSNWQ